MLKFPARNTSEESLKIRIIRNKLICRTAVCSLYQAESPAFPGIPLAVKIYDRKQHLSLLNVQAQINALLTRQQGIVRYLGTVQDGIWSPLPTVSLKQTQHQKDKEQKSSNIFLCDITEKELNKLSQQQQVSNFVLMVFYQNGDLMSQTIKNGCCSEQEAQQITRSILNTIDSIFNFHQILHCDIKPENILITKNKSYPYVLTDFALGHITGLFPQRSIVADTHYCAPEIFHNRKDISLKSEIFSIATTIFVVYMAQRPFQKANITDTSYRLLLEEKYGRFWNQFKKTPSSGFRSFFESCTKRIPDKRPKIKDILQTNWLKVVEHSSFRPLTVLPNISLKIKQMSDKESSAGTNATSSSQIELNSVTSEGFKTDFSLNLTSSILEQSSETDQMLCSSNYKKWRKTSADLNTLDINLCLVSNRKKSMHNI